MACCAAARLVIGSVCKRGDTSVRWHSRRVWADGLSHPRTSRHHQLQAGLVDALRQQLAIGQQRARRGAEGVELRLPLRRGHVAIDAPDVDGLSIAERRKDCPGHSRKVGGAAVERVEGEGATQPQPVEGGLHGQRGLHVRVQGAGQASGLRRAPHRVARRRREASQELGAVAHVQLDGHGQPAPHGMWAHDAAHADPGTKRKGAQAASHEAAAPRLHALRGGEVEDARAEELLVVIRAPVRPLDRLLPPLAPEAQRVAVVELRARHGDLLWPRRVQLRRGGEREAEGRRQRAVVQPVASGAAHAGQPMRLVEDREAEPAAGLAPHGFAHLVERVQGADDQPQARRLAPGGRQERVDVVRGAAARGPLHRRVARFARHQQDLMLGHQLAEAPQLPEQLVGQQQPRHHDEGALDRRATVLAPCHRRDHEQLQQRLAAASGQLCKGPPVGSLAAAACCALAAAGSTGRAAGRAAKCAEGVG